jgi:hypothetical protein
LVSFETIVGRDIAYVAESGLRPTPHSGRYTAEALFVSRIVAPLAKPLWQFQAETLIDPSRQVTDSLRLALLDTMRDAGHRVSRQ